MRWVGAGIVALACALAPGFNTDAEAHPSKRCHAHSFGPDKLRNSYDYRDKTWKKMPGHKVFLPGCTKVLTRAEQRKKRRAEAHQALHTRGICHKHIFDAGHKEGQAGCKTQAQIDAQKRVREAPPASAPKVFEGTNESRYRAWKEKLDKERAEFLSRPTDRSGRQLWIQDGKGGYRRVD